MVGRGAGLRLNREASFPARRYRRLLVGGTRCAGLALAAVVSRWEVRERAGSSSEVVRRGISRRLVVEVARRGRAGSSSEVARRGAGAVSRTVSRGGGDGSTSRGRVVGGGADHGATVWAADRGGHGGRGRRGSTLAIALLVGRGRVRRRHSVFHSSHRGNLPLPRRSRGRRCPQRSW